MITRSLIRSPEKRSSSIATSIAETAPLRSEPLTDKDPENDKLHVERALMQSKVPSTIIRLPPMYGANDPLRRMYPLIFRMIDKRPFIVIPESQANWRWTHGYMRIWLMEWR